MTTTDESEQLEKTKHQELARAFGHYIRLSKEQNVSIMTTKFTG